MALKRPYQLTATFSMASMTDVIFLLLIFFMVTSTFVLPNALDVNLPESSREQPLRPGVRVFIDRDGILYATFEAEEPKPMEPEQLLTFLRLVKEQEADPNADRMADRMADYVAVYADEAVTYGELIKVLDMGGEAGVKMVLATVPAPPSVRPPQSTATTPQSAPEAPSRP